MAEAYDPRIGAYFEAAFFSGLRPEEEIALRWTKIDDATRTGVIDVARTAFADKVTKNYELRTVHFNPRAWAAIQRMRSFTYLKPHGHVFENPRTDEPWASEADQRDLYWTPTLKRLRIRHRTPYKARATCATMYLMMGKEPGWIAAELGHSERVFWEAYAETIRQVRHGDEHVDFEAQLAKLKAAS
jgi:integrase